MTWKIFLVLGLLTILCSCRKFETTIKFTELKQHNGWVYIEKFRFAEGVGKFQYQIYVRGKAKSKSNHQLYIQGVPSGKWENQTQKKCKSPVTMPVMIENMRMTGQKMINTFQFSVNEEDTYYFVLKDCLNMFRKDYENEDLVLHIKFHAFSNDIQLQDGPEVLIQDQDEHYEIHEEASSEEQKVKEVEKAAEVAEVSESLDVVDTPAQTVESESVPQQIQEQDKKVQQL